MTKGRWRVFALTAAAILLALGLGMIWGERGPVYPVLDSGHSSFERDIVWLDNHRVLFRGFEGGELPTAAKRKGLYIWDTRTNQVSWYGRGGGHLCFYNGLVYYEYYGGEKPTKELPYQESWKIGLLGSEKYHVHQYKTGGISRNNALKRSWIDCRLQHREALQDERWLPLRRRDGYLVDEKPPKGSKRTRVPVYVSPSRGVRQKLPFGRLVPQQIQWAPFRSAYFILPAPMHYTEKCSDGTEGWNGVWLYPDGRIERECIPIRSVPDYGGGVVEATALGVVVRSLTKGREGLYLPAVYGRKRLIKGIAGYPVVSPDGCRIAFGHVYDYDILSPHVPGTRTIKMIDLCAGKNAQ